MKLDEFLDYLQARRRLDTLLILYENGETTWNQAEKLLKARGKIMSDSTWRDACKELVQLGLAEALPVPHRSLFARKYRLTDQACLLTSVVDAMVRDVGILSKEIEVVAH